jgi:hypothetical protein
MPVSQVLGNRTDPLGGDDWKMKAHELKQIL